MAIFLENKNHSSSKDSLSRACREEAFCSSSRVVFEVPSLIDEAIDSNESGDSSVDLLENVDVEGSEDTAAPNGDEEGDDPLEYADQSDEIYEDAAFNDFEKSLSTSDSLEDITIFCRSPGALTLIVSSEPDRPVASPPGYIYLYEDCFMKYGLRFRIMRRLTLIFLKIRA